MDEAIKGVCWLGSGDIVELGFGAISLSIFSTSCACVLREFLG